MPNTDQVSDVNLVRTVRKLDRIARHAADMQARRTSAVRPVPEIVLVSVAALAVLYNGVHLRSPLAIGFGILISVAAATATWNRILVRRARSMF